MKLSKVSQNRHESLKQPQRSELHGVIQVFKVSSTKETMVYSLLKQLCLTCHMMLSNKVNFFFEFRLGTDFSSNLRTVIFDIFTIVADHKYL